MKRKKQSLKKRLSKVEAEVRRLNDLYGNDVVIDGKPIEPAVKEIDWSVSGQLVEREYNGHIQVLEITGLHNGQVFSAVVKQSSQQYEYKAGYCGNDWLKSIFKLKAQR